MPATLVFCYLESVKLLEESFAHADEALRCGVRCMEMAPTFSAAFRQTARAYMLVGDLESAASALVACLRIALQPEEIAIAYYQLAYVEWKAGRLDTGVACYLKSIMKMCIRDRRWTAGTRRSSSWTCLLYTSPASTQFWEEAGRRW